MKTPLARTILRACSGAAALLLGAGSVHAGFSPYVIRNASASPYNAPTVSVLSSPPGAWEVLVTESGQKVGLGSSDTDGRTLGSLANVAIVRWDDVSRFSAGSGPAVAPYLNFWITDGLGHFAVVANEPSNPDFQPLFNSGYDLTFADLADKPAKIYEVTDKSWLPNNGLNLKFVDLAGYMIQAPSPTQLAVGWAGLGGGAPRELGTLNAWGVNWIFGDTLANYVSGAEGYIVSDPYVAAAPLTEATTIVTPCTPAFGVPDGNHVVGVPGDAAPGFGTSSFASDGIAKTDMYFDPVALFGRGVKLGEVAHMSFWTKKGTTHLVDPRDWYLTIYTKAFAGDVSTPTWYGSRIGCEPYFSFNISDPVNTWNEWTTFGENNKLRFFESTAGAPGATFGSYTDPDWAAFIARNSLGTSVRLRDQEVLSFSLQTASAAVPPFNGQVDGLTIELTDGSVAKLDLGVDSTVPVLTCPDDVTATADGALCTSSVSFAASATDTCAGPASISYDIAGTPITSPYAFPIGITTVNVTASDAVGNSSTCSFKVTVANPAPVVTLVGPAAGSIFPVGASVNFSAQFTDANGGTHSGTWSFDSLSKPATVTEPSGSNPGVATATQTFTAPGVYKVTLTIDDGCGASGSASTLNGVELLVVVYDPGAGFVVGGGWIDSPAGAYTDDPALAGKANFGFVSRYQKGATVPTGETEFEFNVAGFKFHSTSYQWLVVSGAKAQFKGAGQINKSGNYGFLLTATDGQVTGGGGVDKFRIKIWNLSGGAVVYDNALGASEDIDTANPQALGGGSIVIQKK